MSHRVSVTTKTKNENTTKHGFESIYYDFKEILIRF